MKTLAAFVVLLLGFSASSLPVSAQARELAATDLDVDTLMSMHTVGDRAVLQAYNGGACHVTAVSDLPVAVRSVFGLPVPSIFVGQTPMAAHFIASDIDRSYFSNGRVVVSLCTHLKAGAELDALRKSAEKHNVPGASHLAWMWETLSFDQATHDETVLSRFYLDEHGLLVKALGEIFPGLPPLMVLHPTSPSFHHDIEAFLQNHQPVQSNAVAHLNEAK